MSATTAVSRPAAPVRRAVVLGLSPAEAEPTAAERDTGEVDLDGLPAHLFLPQAWQHPPRLAEVLRESYKYDVLPADPNQAPTSAVEVGSLIDSLFPQPSGLGARDGHRGEQQVIVHLLGHGVVEQGELLVLGPDGAWVPRSVDRWMRDAERCAQSRNMRVLFVLDMCKAGHPVLQHWHLAHRNRRVWAIAACWEDEASFDGRLTHALAEVLENFGEDPELQVAETEEFLPYARVFSEVKKRLAEDARHGQPPQEPVPTPDFGGQWDELRFFRNPRFGGDPAVPASSFLDAVADLEHFDTRARGLWELLERSVEDLARPDGQQPLSRAGALPVGAPENDGDEPVRATPDQRDFFRGRATQLHQLHAWEAGKGPAFCVVTGKPGVGKSALLGRLVRTTHAALRSRSDPDHGHEGNLPTAESLAVIHARHRTTAEIAHAVAQQWGLSAQEPKGGWTAGSILDAVADRASPPALVLDALDEADRPADLLRSPVLPLTDARSTSTGRGPDGSPLCRMLVAVRREAPGPSDSAWYGPLLQRAAGSGAGTLIDLDLVPREKLREDLRGYLRSLLESAGGYDSPVCQALAESVAETLTVGEGDEFAPSSLACGEFLVAGLYLRHLLGHQTPIDDVAQAARIGREIPRSLPEVLDLHLTASEDALLRPIAAALAFAEGAGMPLEVIRVATRAFAPAPDLPAPGADDVLKGLSELRHYLRQDVDPEDRTRVYRLFHQGLVDHLRAHPWRAATHADHPVAPMAQGDRAVRETGGGR